MNYKTDSEIEWDKIHPYRQQMLGAYGMSEPDRECKDWKNEGFAGSELKYDGLGCLCCEHLLSFENPPLRNKTIILRCAKEHTLLVAVMKEDD